MLGRLYWIRVGLAAVGGSFAGVVGLVTPAAANLWNYLKPSANPNAYYGAYIAIFIFLITYYIARYSLLKGIESKGQE